jgi:hypothetical protein
MGSGAAGLPSGSGLQENINALVVLVTDDGSCGVHHDPVPIFTRKAHARCLAHPETILLLVTFLDGALLAE